MNLRVFPKGNTNLPCNRIYNNKRTTCTSFVLNSSSTLREETAEFANRVDLDEVAHNEPPHLGLHCLHSSF